MKTNIDDLETKIKEARDKLDAAGGTANASDEDWQVFKDSIDTELDRTKAYMKEMDEELKDGIAQYVNKSN